MANTIRIKRRASGASGAPSSLENAELAYNEVDDVLYYGKGTGGTGGSATTIEAIAGKGAVVTLSGNQTIGGTKTFSSTISGSVDGNAGTATKWATARNLSLTGDATATLSSVDGTGNVSAAVTLATVNSNVGTFTKVTVNGKGLVTAASTAALSDLGAPSADISAGGYKITSLADPVSGTDAATKQYVDNVAQGLDAKQSVRAGTTANITSLSSGAPSTIDGVSLSAGDRVLVKNQSSQAQNGIYTVTTVGTGSNGAWARASDMDAWSEVPNAFVFVEEGTTLADTSWVVSANQGGTLGTTAIVWFQFGSASSYLAGDGLSLSGNTFSVLGTTNRISVSGSGVDIASTYVGQNSITTLGTIATGTWNGSTIGVAYGGTGTTSFTSGALLKGAGTSAITTATAGTDYLDPSSTIDGGTF